MSDKKIFDPVNSQVDFVSLEHEILEKWEKENTFQTLVDKNHGNK